MEREKVLVGLDGKGELMLLKNKKTGEIKDVESLGHEKSLRDKYGPQITLSWNTEYENLGECKTYNSLAELNEEWEDYEESKEYWYLSGSGEIRRTEDDGVKFDRYHKEIGNYFSSREEAEQAVEKLRALKRLKDKGFEIEGWDNNIGDDYYKTGQIVLNLNNVRNREWDEYDQIMEIKNDLDLLFGGEE